MRSQKRSVLGTWYNAYGIRVLAQKFPFPIPPARFNRHLTMVRPAFTCAMVREREGTQQKRTCKIMQESCKNLACKTCLSRARDMSLFLHNLAQSCTNFCKILQKCARNSKLAGNYSYSISCKILHHFLQESCKIVQELCKIVQEKGHIVCTCQASLACKILARFLHDLASSFLLGSYT